MLRKCGLFVLLACVVPGAHAKAQVAVVNVKSFDALMDDVNYLAAQAGAGNLGKRLEAYLGDLTGGKGLLGIDRKRTLGAYLHLPSVEGRRPGVAAFIPVTSDKDFLALLTELGAKSERTANAEHLLIEFPSIARLGLRFMDDHAYLGTASAFPNTKLPGVSELVVPQPNAVVSLRFFVDRVPRKYKTLLLDAIERSAKALPRDDELEFQVGKLAAKSVTGALQELFDRVGHVDLTAELRRMEHKLGLELCATLRNGKSPGSGKREVLPCLSAYLAKEAVASFVNRSAPADDPQEDLGVILKELRLDEVLAFGFDAAGRTFFRQVYQACEGLSSPGGLDFTIAVHRSSADGPRHTLIAAFRANGTKKLERLMRDAAKDTPAHRGTTDELDFAEHARTKIHRIASLQQVFRGIDSVRRVFGNADIYLAFREDAIFVSFGKDGLEMIKKALDGWGRDTVWLPPQQRLEISVAKVCSLLEVGGTQLNRALSETFRESGRDQLRLVISDNAVRLEASTHLLKLLTIHDRWGSERRSPSMH